MTGVGVDFKTLVGVGVVSGVAAGIVVGAGVVVGVGVSGGGGEAGGPVTPAARVECLQQ